MELTPYQIAVIALSFFGILIFALLVQWRDRRSEIKKEHVESFSVLMSVFFWGVAMTFLLKMGLDLIAHYASDFNETTFFFIASLFLEELAKIIALLIGVSVAGKAFNELSDGVIYTAFAALGFLFLENIHYVLRFATGAQSVAEILVGRNIFTLGVHLFTVVFGIHYAFAYIASKRTGHSLIQPWQIIKHIKILWHEFGLGVILWLPFAPFVTLWKFFSKGLKFLTIPEMLWSGFLLSSYLHIGYDLILEYNFGSPGVTKMFHAVTFLAVLVFLWVLVVYFPKLDVAMKDVNMVYSKKHA